jgi:hypothetical protein
MAVSQSGQFSFTRLYRHHEQTLALGAWETQIVGVGRHIGVRYYEICYW